MRFISQGNRNYAGRYKPDREWNKKSQPEYGEKLVQGLGMQLKLEFVPMPTKNKM